MGKEAWILAKCLTVTNLLHEMKPEFNGFLNDSILSIRKSQGSLTNTKKSVLTRYPIYPLYNNNNDKVRSSIPVFLMSEFRILCHQVQLALRETTCKEEFLNYIYLRW